MPPRVNMPRRPRAPATPPAPPTSPASLASPASPAQAAAQARPKKVGRPRKADNEGTSKERKKREYMRKYIESINQGIENLAQDERDCMKELDRITQEKKRLLDQLDTANAQMVGILNERLGR